jgi:hypothetical protein
LHNLKQTWGEKIQNGGRIDRMAAAWLFRLFVDHGTDGLWWYYCNTTTPLSSQQHPLRIMLDVCGGTL